jgi:prepilin-type N-terminal cleavage/methylation domain-containing protein
MRAAFIRYADHRECIMRTRNGFTLVELMVAMALTIFIMLILTQAFILSIDTFSGMKGVGDMQENLRAGVNALRYDLSQNHLEGMRRVSDPAITGQKPTQGFFAIYQGSAATSEGTDLDGMPSSRATGYVLHFASRLKGNQQQSFYSTFVNDPSGNFFKANTFYNLPPGLGADVTLTTYAPGTTSAFYRSQWAEIAYFLVQTGTSEEPLNPAGTTGMPLYGLYRVQFVAVTDPTQLVGQCNQLGGFLGMACNQPPGGPPPPPIVFYGPQKLAAGTRTFTPANPQAARTTQVASLVVPNVVSFQVQVLQQGLNAPSDLLPLVASGAYDTASNPPFALRGVYITLRVWDNKTRQTRQTSMLQDL